MEHPHISASDKSPNRKTAGFTREVIDRARSIRLDALPASSVVRAKHCLLDWFGVTIGGGSHPATRILRETLLEESARPDATVVGSRQRASPFVAALINGTAGHVLDFDDGFPLVRTHPTVPVAPALFALAEVEQSVGEDVLAAFVAGVDVEARIGLALGASHYSAGWHATGTLGTFGAAAACCHLLNLGVDKWENALGLAATQAAGLCAMFGTMSKPLHAGKAAQNGLLAAQLARRGFTSHPAAIEADLGFARTQAPQFEPQDAFAFPMGEHAVDNVLFKRYAACAGTHSAIDAARQLREEHGVSADDIKRLTVELPELLFGVCNIQCPQTALEAKFSVRFTTAVALLGGDLNEQGFTDELTHDPRVAALCTRIDVEPRAGGSPDDISTTPLTAYLRDGRQVHACVVAGRPTPDADLGEQRMVLERKCRGLTTSVIGSENTESLIEKVSRLEELTSISDVIALLRAPA